MLSVGSLGTGAHRTLSLIALGAFLFLATGCGEPIKPIGEPSSDSAAPPVKPTTPDKPSTPQTEPPAESSPEMPSPAPPPQPEQTGTPPAATPSSNGVSLKQQMIGLWIPTTIFGEVVPAQSGLNPMEITEDTVSEIVPQPSKYELDESTNPARISIDGPDGQKMRALIRVDGDVMTMKMSDPRQNLKEDMQFPTSWDDPNAKSIVMQRAKEGTMATNPAVNRGDPIIQFESNADGVYASGGAIRSDNKAIAVCLSGELLLWDRENERKITRIAPELEHSIHDISWSPDGKWIGVAGEYAGSDKRFGCIIYNAETLQPAIEMQAECRYVLFSQDSRFFATGGTKTEPKLWSTTTGKVVYELKTGTNKSDHGAISPDSQWFATTSYGDKAIVLFQCNSGKKVADLPVPQNLQVMSMIFTPDNRNLLVAVSGDFEGVLQYDLQTKEATRIISDEQIGCLACSADGKVLVTGIYDDIQIRDPRTFEVLETLSPIKLSSSQISISADGRYLVRSNERGSEVYDRQAHKFHPTLQWPPPLSPQQQAELKRSQHFFGLDSMLLNTEDYLANIEKDGKAILSWRARVARTHASNLPLDYQAPWDSPTNLKVMEKTSSIFSIYDPPVGKTVIQMVTGPGAAWNGTARINPGKDPDTLLLVETAVESAVPWLAPQDFAYDPNDPWKGLPRGGFHALFTNGSLGFVRGDTPPEVLKAMFTVDGGEPVDRKKWVLSTTMRFAFGPDEKNPLPPFSPN
ncbi:hypothetical protein C5Y97_11765 [Blastopirellula marina]|nr:hypothetical protein C5Y97_11765 [Blastopirellula marina]